MEDAMLQVDYHSLNEEKIRLTGEFNDLKQELERQIECLNTNKKYNLDYKTFEEKEDMTRSIAIDDIQDPKTKEEALEAQLIRNVLKRREKEMQKLNTKEYRNINIGKKAEV